MVIDKDTAGIARYIDRIAIVQMVEEGRNDEEIGKFIKEYILFCKKQYDNDIEHNKNF